MRRIAVTLRSCFAWGLIALSSAAAAEDEIRVVQVGPGPAGTTVEDGFSGYDSVLVQFEAQAGDRLSAALDATSTAAYMNLYAPGREPGDEALIIGELTQPDLNRFDFILPETGLYGISVFQVRAAARRGETVEFRLDLDLANGSGAAAAEPPTTTQRVRFAPGTTGADLQGELAPGEAVNYLRGAGANQFLDVRMDAGGNPDLRFNVFGPDGGLLYESGPAGEPAYRGQLWLDGDHMVTVLNTGSRTAGYAVTVTID